ncbi:transmembrane protein adipocyte-associated 1 isoform X1 [Exaiptasia diaphana]|uniref:Uncharacterized protein n=1 Tax=Exaiptasia diaphana TaxID=2652724 RepID=A0A913XML6_EXADI|nr:transmembrane protein adipocyte-associated 1 isoform X1 [Exaiptasia diaphana]KXJ20181.1 Transmembrane protein adipocyte-associated 1 [Exaiptasia diaphana]
MFLLNESPTNSTKPEKKIKEDWCNRILYETISGKIRILDIILLVPNAIFLIFLFYGLSVAHTKFSRVRTPIVRTIYSLVFADSMTGVLKSFISMFLTIHFVEDQKNNVAIEVLWLAWRCFVLGVELCVIIFALFSVDNRFGVRRVILVSALVAVIFTATQAFLEFQTKKDDIYGGKYALFQHGGMMFWFISSVVFGTVYCLIVILPFTRLREYRIFPAKKSFYWYCGVLSVVNILQSIGSGLVAFAKKSVGVCLVDFTSICYFALFAPLVYCVFLSDFLGSNTDYLLTTQSNTSETYQPIPDKLLEGHNGTDGDSDSDDDDDYVPKYTQYGAIS